MLAKCPLCKFERVYSCRDEDAKPLFGSQLLTEFADVGGIHEIPTLI